MTTRRAGRDWIAGVCAAVALGCGDDGDNGPVGTTGSIQIAVAPTSLTLPAGSSGSATIAITRTNFAGAVTLVLENPPAGITGTFTPSPSTAATSVLEVRAAASVSPGAHALTIRASAEGVTDRTTALDLTVTPNSGSSITWEFCNALDVPVFFAYQDGDGAWQPLTGSTAEGSTTFMFSIGHGRGGVVAVWRYASSVVADALVVGRADPMRRLTTGASALRPGRRARAPRGKTRTFSRSSAADLYETFVVFASTAELAEVGGENCYPAEETKTITGTVSGVAAGQYGVATLGPATRIFNGAEPVNPLTFTDVPDGPVDFIGTRIVTPGSAPDKLILVRDLDIPDGGTLPFTIDYSAASALTPATATATMLGGDSDPLEVFTELVTARRTLLMWFDLAPSTNNVRPWAGVPPSAMQSGEYHGIVVFASASARLGENNFRVSSSYVPSVTDQTINFGPLLDPPASSAIVAGAYPRFRFQGTLTPEYHKRITIDLFNDEEEGNAYYMLVTAAWLAAAGSALAYDIAMPDVTGLAGFPIASRLPQGTHTLAFSASGFTGPGVWGLIPAVGRVSTSVIRTGAINIP